MKTEIYHADTIKEAAKQIQAGQLIAFPTETVYGLGADATNETAVKQVYIAKGRPSDNPLIVHVANVETVEKYAQPLSEKTRLLMKTFWPGPLTIILQLKPGALSKSVTGGLTTAAFRNPRNQTTLDLIREAGVPIVGPSANTSGKPSPTEAKHVYHDLHGKIAGILDDGPTQIGVESTVLDMSGDVPTVLRPGGVSKEKLEAVIGTVRSDHHKVGKNEVPKAPGMKYKHYAPNAQVLIVADEQWPEALKWAAEQTSPVGVMTTKQVSSQNEIPANGEWFSLGDDVQSASHNLFAGLRHFDTESSVAYILAQKFDKLGLGEAYMNRLEKSAGQQYFQTPKQ
ncbi:TsaC protein (YrdC domain) required for threonylcarbamoyladenosine t(6)A37 modification in tRNA [Pediococcus damnosus]|uniref:L-threonylcarbamoyladenylate synthase n=1 Tax=Pediococcus damnosus TaxID=51663 RepID=UPI00078CFE21|nr:L-threonylcarbamoyladenylate synthase [Pediococcus damnosus]AMV69015.1 TsaC protein (YrdC domain) required for threonylcarbamoyladenosine t(6)A37 modification in tRNA [Pediococcus damnosus]